MCPITHFSFLALGVSAIVAFIFGFLWYGPIFGKTWMQLMGIKMEAGCKPAAWIFPLTFLGTLSTVFVLAYILGNCKFCCSPSGAFMIWIGFYVPLLLGAVTWEGRPWKLFFLNASYYFLSLQLVVAILTYLK